MVDLFEDEGGEWRYRIKGENGEPMVTSEGYPTKTGARRGYIDLRKLMSGPPLIIRVVPKQ
jgi:uncharacterized protein YegP (UPF0339 family)